MKKPVMILFALMFVSHFTFGLGKYWRWNGGFTGDWTFPDNWQLIAGGALPYPGAPGPGPGLYPGQTAADVDDWVVFNEMIPIIVVKVPTCTLGMLEITYVPPQNMGTLVNFLGGDPFGFVGPPFSADGNTITINTPNAALVSLNLHWTVKVDNGCQLDLDNTGNLSTPDNRVKLVCMPGAHFWQKNSAIFYPADYSAGGTVCDQVNKGFVLEANAADHAEFIQQFEATQTVKGWIEYVFDDNKYHFVCPPVTSEFTPEFLQQNSSCRKPNCLFTFTGDYLRKFNNGGTWDNWLGNLNGYWDPLADITTGRGYEYYGAPGNNPGGIYSFYGTLNNLDITLPVTDPGWNFIGNPFPSAITFGEPCACPIAGIGWTWNAAYNDPIAYWWDNTLNNYRYYNWYIGLGNGANYSERRTIPRSQGFFVYARALHQNGSTDPITIGNLARIFRGTEQIGKSVITNNMNITLKDASGKIIDEAVINFREDASGTEFNHLLDAYKIYNYYTNPSQLYFKTTDNVDAAMKTLKPETGKVMYPVYMKVVNSGTYSLDVRDISSFSANTGILLKDNKTDITVDLKANPVYTFTATAGDDNARFSLYFSDVLNGVNNLTEISYQVYSNDKSIYIKNNDLKSATGTAVVYDMIGKQMIQENLNSDGITMINTNLSIGFYIVSVKTDKGVYNQKIYIN
jgi:hypothetical protein